MYPFGMTVALASRTANGKDAYNDDVYQSVVTNVPGCLFAPGGSTESINGAEQVITQPTLYMPTGTDVSAIDQVTVPGYGMFEVDGLPQRWPPHPRTGWQPSNSVILRLKQVTG